MAAFMNIQASHLAPVFAGASILAARRKSKTKSKGKRGGGGGKSNKFKGLFQFTDVDEEKVVRLARRKQYVSKDVIAAKAPMAVWMRVVTDAGQTLMVNADQFEAGAVKAVSAATPHFS